MKSGWRTLPTRRSSSALSPSWEPAGQHAAPARLTARILQALFRTRTGDPFLTMEVLYQLS